MKCGWKALRVREVHLQIALTAKQARKLLFHRKKCTRQTSSCKIAPTYDGELEYFKPGPTLISALQMGYLSEERVQALLRTKVISLAYEFIEDKVGGMPIIRAMSEMREAPSCSSQLNI